MSGQRICYVHAGTHKTGTKSIQYFLVLNRFLLRQADMHVPATGRIPHHDGHHNIPWDLMGDRRFDQANGTFDVLLAEMAHANAGVVCLSSEEFSFLHTDRNAIRRLRDGLRSAGYEMRVVIYLRPQLDFARAMWSELVRQGDPRTLSDVLDACLQTGAIGEAPRASTLEYEAMLDAFAAVAGPESLIVRRFPSTREPPVTLIGDYFRIVREGAAITSDLSVSVPGRRNVSTPTADGDRETLRAYAAPMLERFTPHRRAVLDRYGIDLPVVGDELGIVSTPAAGYALG